MIQGDGLGGAGSLSLSLSLSLTHTHTHIHFSLFYRCLSVLSLLPPSFLLSPPSLTHLRRGQQIARDKVVELERAEALGVRGVREDVYDVEVAVEAEGEGTGGHGGPREAGA